MVSHLASLWKWDFLELGNGLISEQKTPFTYQKSSTPTGLVWDTNMAAVSSNLAAVTSCENAL